MDGVAGAADPAALREALSDAWARLEDLYLVRWDLRFDQTVLFKGLDGVLAEPFEELSLRAANEWNVLSDQTGE